MLKIRRHLDSIIKFLDPLLPLANCHMVEFFTEKHWDNLLPTSLRASLENLELKEAMDRFWTLAEKSYLNDASELHKWIHTMRSNCIAVNNSYCISRDGLQDRIKSWGGQIQTEITVKEFMNSKKSYEVQTMAALIASLHNARRTSCCVEAGGGRGHLPVALTLGYGVPSLTIDCNQTSLASAKERIKLIQKQWHAIAKRVDGGKEKLNEGVNKNLHRFATAYVTKDTDLAAIVREKFPEFAKNNNTILLTGLHTCGNLGPDSLRIFTSQSSVSAVFNVPCCYHLLTEEVDRSMFDVFQKDYGHGEQMDRGFPMSENLRGYNLGRNARMLAAQSIDRVVKLRQVPSKSLLYRALLQVIIKKHLPDFPLSEGKLKRASNKCDDFEQYFKMADETLRLKLYDTLETNYFTDFCKDMDTQWKELVLFYLLRLCLAQVIESVILLDRLLYLCENGFNEVFLVKLFDPVLSPRCHSIVAIR